MLELTFGISLISIGLLSTLGSFAKAMAAQKASEDYFKAGILLEENIYSAYNTSEKEGAAEGIFRSYRGRFSWRSDMRKMEGDFLSEAIFEVFSRYGKPDIRLTVITYI